MEIQKLITRYGTFTLILYLAINIVRCSILNKVKSNILIKSEDDTQKNEYNSKNLPKSVYSDLENKNYVIKENDRLRLNMEDERASNQYYSKMSKLYSKKPYKTNTKLFPKHSANNLKFDKFVEGFYKSSSMLTMEEKIDQECIGELLEAEKISQVKMISFKCPIGSTISYIKFEYKEMIYKTKRTKKKSNLEHIEIAITGLGFGCDDNQSFIDIGSLADIKYRLSIPQQKKMWINNVVALMDKSITGQEFLTGLSVSGIDGIFGINNLNDEMNKINENPENFRVVPKSYLSKSKEWKGSFITGGCVGLYNNKHGIFINKIAFIPIKVHPFSTIPLNDSVENYSYIGEGIKTSKVLAVPKLWPECQMLFGKSSGIHKSNFFLFKFSNKSKFLFFNFVEVKYNSKQIPVSIEFRETSTKSSVLLGSQNQDSSLTTVSRVGLISQITIGISEETISEINLGLISYLEVVIDGINTIFIRESAPSYKRTFSGEGLKYICAEISNSGLLLGFGAFFSRKLYLLPFIKAGIQTHYFDLNGVFYLNPNLNKNQDSEKNIQYLVLHNKKRSFNSIVEFISDDTIDVYQGRSITNNLCNFGVSTADRDDIEFYLVTCKPGYYLKSFSIFSYFPEDMIRAFEIGCGNGEVRIGEKTSYKAGTKIMDYIQESESLNFEIGIKGENLSQNFAPVSLKLCDNKGNQCFEHKTIDLKLKKIITSDSKVSWKYSRDGPFKGICFAIDKNNTLFRGISLAAAEKNQVPQISNSIVRPNIFYPLDYKAIGPAYIAFGNVAIASRLGASAPEECNNNWIIDRNIKKFEKIKNIGSFAFTCPKEHIITHIHTAANRNTGLMGIVGLLCSDGYSGAVIGSSQDLLDFENVSLVENLLGINPPYFIESVVAGSPRIFNDKFLAKLETFASNNVTQKNLIYKYLSKRGGLNEKKEIKTGEVDGGPFDTFCALIQSRFIGNEFKSKKEGILNIGLKSAKKYQTLKGGNPIITSGNIFVNQISYPQCQMIKSPLSNEIRETFTVSCPYSSNFTEIVPIKYDLEENSEITAFLLKCSSGGLGLLGYLPVNITSEGINILNKYKAYKTELPMQYLTKINVSFDFKKPGIQGFDLFTNDGRSSLYPLNTNKEEIDTLYTRKYIGNSLKMLCIEFGEDSKKITGFGAYFESQGLYWESSFILPSTDINIFKSVKRSKDLIDIEKSNFVKTTNTHLILNSNIICKEWAGIHDVKKNLSFALSCGNSSIKKIKICSMEAGAEISGIEVVCDSLEESSFLVGICNEGYKKWTHENNVNISEFEFAFSKYTNKLGFFLSSAADKTVLVKYKSNIIKSEGLGNDVYWSFNSNNNQILSTLCFDVSRNDGKIQAIGIPYRTNNSIWEEIKNNNDEEIEISDEKHYASEPKESRTVRGLPRINSETDLKGTNTISLNKLYGGYITYDKNEFSSHCRKLIGIHKDNSKPIAILCPEGHRIANIILYLNSSEIDSYVVGMKISCHGQFKSQRSSLEDSWTGMFNVGTVTQYIYKQGTQATTFKRLAFGLNSENKIVYVYISDSVGRKYLKYSSSEEVSKMTEYIQSENYNYLRGLCVEIDEHNIHRVGFVIE